MAAIRRSRWWLSALLAAGAVALALSPRTSSAAASRQSRIARGKYLVDDVAMCSECHTPRDESGRLDAARYLQGAPIWITPVHPIAGWANRAPSLSGLGAYSEEQAETILEKGQGPNGIPIESPMHVYHMSPADAKAVIAYLKSLPDVLP